MNEIAAIEVPVLVLRRANPKAPTELVVSHGGGVCLIYRLRPNQLRQLAIDATAFALGTSTSSRGEPSNGKPAAGK